MKSCCIGQKPVLKFDIASINGDSATLFEVRSGPLRSTVADGRSLQNRNGYNDGFRAALLCRQLPAARGLKKRKSSEDDG